MLLKDLTDIGLNNIIFGWFRNDLHNRSQYVVADDAQSELLNINKGVPQGSILGPVLFTIYNNNLRLFLNNCWFHLYADDIILYADKLSMLLIHCSTVLIVYKEPWTT